MLLILAFYVVFQICTKKYHSVLHFFTPLSLLGIFACLLLGRFLMCYGMVEYVYRIYMPHNRRDTIIYLHLIILCDISYVFYQNRKE